MSPAIIVLIVVVCLIIGIFISIQRRFVEFEELSNNALSQIGVQQQSRWDALSQLVKAVRAYSDYEADTLLKVVAARKTGSPRNAGEVLKDDQAFEEALSNLNLVVERYPDLKASSLYTNAMDSINSYEDKVRKSRMVFNDTITKWNKMVRQIPSNRVAKKYGYTTKDYLKTPEGKTDMPDLEF